MIKKFIDRLLGKKSKPAEPPELPLGSRVEVLPEVHRIDRSLVDERAIKVVDTLAAAGHDAYIVGGAVRDLLVGLRPKDFDVATSATPEQVKSLFRRAFIIGRRFRIVHVVFGRGREHEVIEVSTFRALVDAADSNAVGGDERGTKGELAGKAHAVDASGRVLRDNVWGTQQDDAARRDFTVNAMYYDPAREIVVDYHGGMADAKKKLLRMIGDAAARYREDPVRIIRVVRFAAKLGFEIETKTRAPIRQMVGLLDNVPPSRTFDEMVKLLQTGHALASIEELEKQGLHRGVFPVLDVALDEAHRHDGREKFVQLALADTDRRVGEGKPVAPSFLLACLLWHDVQGRWDLLKAAGEPPVPALQQAIDAAFDARIGDISGRGKLAADMREIWLMQPRFERRSGGAPIGLVGQPRFRAGFDFLRLCADAGEADAELARWWEDFSTAADDTRAAMLQAMRAAPRRVAGPRRAAGATATAAVVPVDDQADNEADRETGDEAAPLATDARRRRRRRRRRPAGEGGAPPVDSGPAP